MGADKWGWVLAVVLTVVAVITHPHEGILIATAFFAAIGAGVLYATGLADRTLWGGKRPPLPARTEVVVIPPLPAQRQALPPIPSDRASDPKWAAIGRQITARLLIIEARWGKPGGHQRDVGDIVRGLVVNNRAYFEVGNRTFGEPDPAHGSTKYLNVRYEYAGQAHNGRWQEGDLCQLPLPSPGEEGKSSGDPE